MKRTLAIAITTAAATTAMLTGLMGNLEASPRDQSIELSLKNYNFDYNEIVPSPLKSSESGDLQGYHLDFRSNNHDSNMIWDIRLDQTNQKTVYDGTTQVGVPLVGVTSNKMTTFETKIGKNISKDTQIYTGLGEKNWDRKLEAGEAQMLEQYSWGYIPLGVKKDFKINDKVTASLDLSANVMIGGNIKVHGDGDANSDYVQMKLGKRMGYKIEAPVSYKLDQKWSAIITPYYEKSAIGKSNLGYISDGTDTFAIYEPSSKTNQYGVNVGVKYKF